VIEPSASDLYFAKIMYCASVVACHFMPHFRQ